MITRKRAFIKRCVFISSGSLLAILLLVFAYMHVRLKSLSKKAAVLCDAERLAEICDKMDNFGWKMAHKYEEDAYYKNPCPKAKFLLFNRLTSCIRIYPWGERYARSRIFDDEVQDRMQRILQNESNPYFRFLTGLALTCYDEVNKSRQLYGWRNYLETYLLEPPSDIDILDYMVGLSDSAHEYNSRDAWDWFFRNQNLIYSNESLRRKWVNALDEYFRAEEYSISPTTLRMTYQRIYEIGITLVKEGKSNGIDYSHLLKENAGHYLHYPFTDTGTDEDELRYNQYFHQVLVPQHKEEDRRRGMLFHFLRNRFGDDEIPVWNAIMADMKTHWKLVRDRYLTIDQIAEWVEKHPSKSPPKPSTEDVVLPWETHIPGIKQ